MILNYYHITDESELDTKDFEPGSIYFCVSTGRLCLDTITGNNRVWVNENYIVLPTEVDRENLTDPINNKLYIVLDSKSIYLYYNNEWNKLSGDNNVSIDSAEVENIVNNILTDAKNSGEFDGKDGTSPTISVAAIDGGNSVTIADVDGEKVINIMDGKDGISPTITTSAIDGGNSISISDINGQKTINIMDGKDGINGTNGVGIKNIEQTTTSEESGGNNILTITLSNGNTTEFSVKNGIDGSDGTTPNLSIGTVNTLTPGSKATASISGTAENPVLNLGIPRGATGASSTNTSTSTEGSSVPDYVRTEAERVAALVQSRQNANSITFIAGSDIHARLEYSSGSYTTTQMLASTSHAAQAMNIIINNIHVDFVALLGDYLWDSGESADQAMNMFRVIYEYFNPAFRGIPQFWAKGNHDFLDNSANGNIALTDTQVFTGIGIHNSGNIFDSANRIKNYCYRDFDGLNIRVICLNTSDSAEYGISNDQITWLNTILSEAKGSNKKVIILSHIAPDDFGENSTIVKAIAEYEETVIACIHGHIHNHSIDIMSGTTNIPRIAVPCINFYRTRDWEGSETAENIPFSKISDTFEDTAFTVFTFDFDNNMIYADYYGAGCNRTYNMTTGEITITAFSYITYELYNVNSSNMETSISTGSTYETTLTSADGSDINSYRVTMNGEDITDSVYTDGKISITNVTGNIVISASTEDSSMEEEIGSNLATLVAEASDSTEPYNGTGYKNGYRLTSGGTNESAAAGYVLTGFINYKLPSTGSPECVYIKGASLIDTDSNCRMFFFDSTKAKEYLWLQAGGSGSGPISDYFTITTLDNGYTKLVPIISDGKWIGYNAYTSVISYFRISLKGSGDNLKIYIGELPNGDESGGSTDEPALYTITYNLTNASSTNNITAVSHGESYTSTLSFIDNSDIETISITMGGNDITDNVYVNNVITIPEVTGNIIITAIAKNNSTGSDTYTNQIPISISTPGSTEIYNGIGYKTDTRINSGFEELPNIVGMCCTGYIPVSSGDTIRIKNVTINGTYSSYGLYYTSTGGVSGSIQQDVLTNTMVDGVITTVVPSSAAAYFRLSCGVIDDTSIITINEEIV